MGVFTHKTFKNSKSCVQHRLQTFGHSLHRLCRQSFPFQTFLLQRPSYCTILSTLNSLQIAPSNSAQRGPAYANYSCVYIAMGAGSEQTVGAPICQWVCCTNDAGLVCLPCTDQRILIFHNMGLLKQFNKKICEKVIIVSLTTKICLNIIDGNAEASKWLFPISDCEIYYLELTV